MGNTIKIRLVEYSSVMNVYDEIEVNIDDYPELEGMNEDEMLEYINKNSSSMGPISNDSYSDNLLEDLQEQDIIREKNYNNSSEIVKAD
jgi:hypothetical protein